MTKEEIVNCILEMIKNECPIPKEMVKELFEQEPSITPTSQEWIPVSERLPKQNEFVGNVAKHYLIQDEFGDMQVAAYTNRGWIPIHTIEAFEYDVVAWQPLPKPYKEGSGIGMTREEAILVLDYARPQTSEVDRQFYDDEDLNNALNMAVEALKMIDDFERAQLITGGRLDGRTYAYKCGLEDGKRKALEPKKGKWIIDRVNPDGDNRIWNCHCSECKKDPQDYIYGDENWWLVESNLPNYCPNCGIEMVGVENE